MDQKAKIPAMGFEPRTLKLKSGILAPRPQRFHRREGDFNIMYFI